MENNMLSTKSGESDQYKRVTFQNTSISRGAFNNGLSMNVSHRNRNQTLEPRSVCIEPEFSEPVEEFTSCDYKDSSTMFQSHLFSKNFYGNQNSKRNLRSQPYNIPQKSLITRNSYKTDTIDNKDIYKNQSIMYSHNLNIHKIPEMHEHITFFSPQQYSASQHCGPRNPQILKIHNVPSFSNYQNVQFPLYLHNQGNEEIEDGILFPHTAHSQTTNCISKDCSLMVKQQAKINAAATQSTPNNLTNHNFQYEAPHTVNQSIQYFSGHNTEVNRQNEALKKYEPHSNKISVADKKKTEDVTEAKNTNTKKSSWLSQVNVKPRLQHFIGSVGQVIRWHQMTKKLDIHAFYETTGTFETVRNGKYFSQRILFIRGEAAYSPPVLQAVFYAIDRELPKFQRGQLITCVGRMIGGNKLHIFDAWETTKESQNGIKRASSLCQRILQEGTM